MFIRCPAIGPWLEVQSIAIVQTNWSPLTTGLPQEALWIVVPLANSSPFLSSAGLPSMIRGHQGASMTSTCRALSAYSSCIACWFLPVLQSSVRRLATFCVAWNSGEGGGGVNDGLFGEVVVLMAEEYQRRDPGQCDLQNVSGLSLEAARPDLAVG